MPRPVQEGPEVAKRPPGPLHGEPGERPPGPAGEAPVLGLQEEGPEVPRLQMGPPPPLEGQPADEAAHLLGDQAVGLLAVADQVGPDRLLQGPVVPALQGLAHDPLPFLRVAPGFQGEAQTFRHLPLHLTPNPPPAPGGTGPHLLAALPSSLLLPAPFPLPTPLPTPLLAP